MELLYNPDSMLEDEIKKTFVARHDLIDELVSLIEPQPDGAGVQHVVIIAPRGMGKTTVLLMVQFRIRDSKLAKRWQVVRFAEESYQVYDLADFWIETLNRLAAETDDPALIKRAEELKTQYRDNDDLQEAALALIKDWRRKHQKRLVILVDNFDMILEQINDERDNARLRDVLMNDGTMMLIGCATTFFREARAYDQPLYNFFKIINLGNLRFVEMQELLRRRAEIDRIPDFEEKLKANASRLRVLEYFTGGSPRLVLMLYRVVTQSDISEVRRGLEKLLDEVTPYYKSKIESLPAQQRKILDHIARVSSKTREGVTPSEIAEATRLKANQVSSQLKRLSELGYVRTANLRERNSYYTLSEPLYAIWHQMRFGRDARQRMQWLVDFLKVWYDATEMYTESKRLDTNFREHLSAGRLREARNALDHRRYLAEAMNESSEKVDTLEAIICSYLELKDFEILKKELITPSVLQNLSEQTLNALYESDCISKKDFSWAKGSEPSSLVAQQQAEASAATELGLKALSEGSMGEALRLFDRALKIKPDLYQALFGRARTLSELNMSQEAIASFDRILEVNSKSQDAWLYRALELDKLNRLEEAVVSYNNALKDNPFWEAPFLLRCIALVNLGRAEEAITAYENALNNNPSWVDARIGLGFALFDLKRYEEAIASLDRALEIDPINYEAWLSRGTINRDIGKYEIAIENFDRALEIRPDLHRGWYYKGVTLADMGNYEEAIVNLDHALDIEPNKDKGWYYRGFALDKLGRLEEALASYNRALEINPEYSRAWHQRTLTLLKEFLKWIERDDLDLARQDWNEALSSSKRVKDKDKELHELFSATLLEAAQQGHLKFVRRLISESYWEDSLFPLARSLDYLLTGDESLIEKLSPEVQGIVKEIVRKLPVLTDQIKQNKTKSHGRRSSSRSRRRTTEQLR
jgi:tetratricopeptide (TPR) repeat protein